MVFAVLGKFKILYMINLSSLPAKACRVVPPIWQAATPVLAVANVCCGGNIPETYIESNHCWSFSEFF
jgi:hypothetical protein